MIGRRYGVSASHEWGLQAGETGTHAIGAMNVDVIQNDPDEGPIARLGVRLRGLVTIEDERRNESALLIRGSYIGLGREAKTRSAGVG